jgi:hypothetical protein
VLILLMTDLKYAVDMILDCVIHIPSLMTIGPSIRIILGVWHDILTNFREEWYWHSSSIKVLPQQFEWL